jgi:5'-deoxynucleotidase YfbR-like HD superfamily hydrolase
MTYEYRRGDWMQLVSGKRFYPLDPRSEEIEITDIAHALAHICRFGGHTAQFYSVAQHSVLVSRICDPKDAGIGLLHDAAEAYLGDMIRPLKRMYEFRNYEDLEERLLGTIGERFDLVLYSPLPASVLHADEVLLATEARDLMGNGTLPRGAGREGVEPLCTRLAPWTAALARETFLQRFQEIFQ